MSNLERQGGCSTNFIVRKPSHNIFYLGLQEVGVMLRPWSVPSDNERDCVAGKDRKKNRKKKKVKKESISHQKEEGGRVITESWSDLGGYLRESAP